jgi:T1SS-143 domain-containing protein
MNAQFQVAQATGSSAGSNSAIPVRIFKLTKPLTDQAVTVNLGYDQKVQLDFTSIANEKITLVHVGEKLIILFDNKSTVTVEPFFDSRHDSLKNLTIEVAPGREVSVNEFASLFPISTDQSVLPAAGEGGNAQASGANFSNPSVDPINAGNPLPLLGQEELGNWRFTLETFDGTPDQPAPALTFNISLLGTTPLLVDESFIPVVGSQQAPAGSNTVTKDFGAALSIVASANIQSVAFALHVDNTTTNLVDSKSGQPVVLVQNGNGEVDGVVTINGQQVLVFTMTVDATGHVTFTELRGVHELTPGDFNEGILLGNGLVSLVVTVTDVNNQVGTASVDLGPLTTILDDGPSIDAVDGEREIPSLETDESYLSSGSHTGDPGTTVATGSFAGQFTHVDGADGASIAYAVSVNGGNGTDSHLVDSLTGHSVFLFTENGVVVGREGATAALAASGEKVFTVEVDAASGTVTLTQLRAVMHDSPDTPNDISEGAHLTNLITLTATITDNDNDTDSASIDIGGQMLLRDDGPSLNEASVTAIVDEDGLTGHNADGTRPGFELTGTGSAQAAGSLTSLVNFGADGPDSVGFKLVTIGNNAIVDSGLTSQGGNVLIVSDGTTLHGYVENGAAGTGFNPGDREVFTLTVDSSGNYTFTLKDQIDHPSKDGQAGDNTENTLTTTLDLSAYIVVTDADGDSRGLNPGTFKLQVQDDIPILTSATESRTVDEDDIHTAWSHGTSPDDGAGDGSTTEDSTGAAFISGSLSSLVSVGADEPGTFGFSSDAIAKLTALGLFSKETATGDGENGKPLYYVQTAGAPGSHQVIITGYEPNPHGNPVFSLTLNTETGAYEFRLFDELIHMPGDDQNTDLRSGQPVNNVQGSIPNIDLGSIITFTDKDGDSVTLTGKFTITVTDDVPHADIDLKGGSVTIDESEGNQADDTTSSSVRG